MQWGLHYSVMKWQRLSNILIWDDIGKYSGKIYPNQIKIILDTIFLITEFIRSCKWSPPPPPSSRPSPPSSLPPLQERTSPSRSAPRRWGSPALGTAAVVLSLGLLVAEEDSRHYGWGWRVRRAHPHDLRRPSPPRRRLPTLALPGVRSGRGREEHTTVDCFRYMSQFPQCH